MLQYLQQVFTEYLCSLSPKGGKKTIVRQLACSGSQIASAIPTKPAQFQLWSHDCKQHRVPLSQGVWEALAALECPACSTNPLHELQVVFATARGITQSRLSPCTCTGNQRHEKGRGGSILPLSCSTAELYWGKAPHTQSLHQKPHPLILLSSQP